MVRFVGFFREVDPSGPDAVYTESIRDALTGALPYPVREVAAYLRSGHPVLDVMESCPDVLTPGRHIRGGSSVLTDGEWAWRWDLAHYVEHYAVSLPAAFLEQVSARSFTMPEVAGADLMAISVEVSEALGYWADPGAGPRPR